MTKPNGLFALAGAGLRELVFGHKVTTTPRPDPTALAAERLQAEGRGADRQTVERLRAAEFSARAADSAREVLRGKQMSTAPTFSKGGYSLADMRAEIEAEGFVRAPASKPSGPSM